jgi:D-alanyl-D-alanine dipeptidase
MLVFFCLTAFAQHKLGRKPATPNSSPAAPQNYRQLLTGAGQLLLVTTGAWNSVGGSLQRFERHDLGWEPVGEKIPVVVGKNGLAWDGLLEAAPTDGPIKMEGDGRSPAGVFPITEIFGFAPEQATAKIPYRQLADTIECVDDPNSRAYNKIVDRNDYPTPDWDSSEKMRSVEVYELGAVIGYNAVPIPGAGSCIFLHISKDPGQGTAGCTAMNEARLKEVLCWLDGSKHPIVVQLPADVYAKLRHSWNLP